MVSRWSETPSHHFRISLLSAFFCSEVLPKSLPSLPPALLGGVATLSAPFVICKRGTLTSNMSSIVDRANVMSAEATEK